MRLSGPQSDRDRLWGPKQPSTRDDLLGRREHDAMVESDMNKLRNENRALRDQVQRAMKELHFYQVKYPSAYQAEHREDDADASLWAAKPEIMVPLLEAYDNRILELEDTSKQQASKLESFREKIETLVQENDDLRSRLLEDLKGGSLGPNGPLNSELLAELSEKVHLLMEENTLLVDQKVQLSHELEQQTDLLSQQKAQIVSLTSTSNELQQECHRLTTHLVAIEKQRDEAVHQAVQVSEALGKAEQEIDHLTEQHGLLQQQLQQANSLVHDLQKQVRLLSSRYHEDASQSVSKMRHAEETVRDLRSQLHKRSQELDNCVAVLRKTKAELASTHSDAQGMLAVMHGMEKQLGEYSEREEQVAKLSAEAREKWEEACMVKEQCAVREEQSRREIERLLAERKATALAKQEDIAEAVQAARKVMSEQQQSMEKEIDQLIQKNAQLMYESEKAVREGQSARDLHQRTQDAYSQHMRQVQADVDQLQLQLADSVQQRERETALRKDMQEQNKELRLLVDRYRAQLEQQRSQLSALSRAQEQSSHSQKQLLLEAQRELAEKTRLLAKCQLRGEESRQQTDGHLEQRVQIAQREAQTALLRLADAERTINTLQKDLVSGEVKALEQMEQVREKYLVTQQQLDARRQADAEKNRQLLVKLKQLEGRLHELEEERAHWQSTAAAWEDKVREVRAQQADGEAMIQELSAQLVTAQQAHEHGVYAALSTVL